MISTYGTQKQHMPGQCPERNFWKLCEQKFLSQVVGTGRAYAELKIAESRSARENLWTLAKINSPRECARRTDAELKISICPDSAQKEISGSYANRNFFLRLWVLEGHMWYLKSAGVRSAHGRIYGRLRK